MTGAELRKMLEELLPAEVIWETVARLGFQQRERKLDAFALVCALVLTGGTPDAGRQAAVLRAYIKEGTQKVSRGAFYGWFNQGLEGLMEELSTRACAMAAAMPPSLPGILSGRKDWRVVDATTVRLAKELQGTWPGAGDYAALKVHMEYSLGVENVVGYHITPARDHDAPQLEVDERRAGTGLLVDLAYVSFDLFRRCEQHDVWLVVRLKSNWNVYVKAENAALAISEDVTADGLTTRVRDGAFHVDPTSVLDVDAEVGPEGAPIPVRLIGVPTPKGYVMFLTNLSRATHTADDIGTLYRLRWNIELANKLCKSGCALDEISAEKPVSALILVHAAMIASILCNAIAFQDEVRRGATGTKTPPMKQGPIHPMLVAKLVWESGLAFGYLLADPPGAMDTWNRLAAAIDHLGRDPNWRKSPSVLDQVKRRVAPRGRPRRSKAIGKAVTVDVGGSN